MLHGIDRGEVSSLHRTRVASRRLREVLPILQIDPDVSRKLGIRLRKVTARLGQVRELDVLAMLVEELQKSGHHDRRALELVASAIADERAHARERLMAKLPKTELHRLAGKLTKLTGQLHKSGDARAERWALEARIVRRASVLEHAIEDAGALYLPDRLHTVRIALKKLRYALELRAEGDGLKSTAELRALKGQQELLGRMHDLQMLVDRVRQLQARPGGPGASSRHMDALVADLENGCRELHAQFVRQRSTVIAICDRIGAKTARQRRRVAS